MDDKELAFWGDFGRTASETTLTLTMFGQGASLLKMWNVIGELEAKVRELESRP